MEKFIPYEKLSKKEGWASEKVPLTLDDLTDFIIDKVGDHNG